MQNRTAQARLLPATEEGIREAADLLAGGNLVSIPTETVYGLAANALDEEASRRIFEIKGRPLIDPLIVHVRGIDHAKSFARINEQARALAEHFWPGPLTMVLEKNGRIPDLITAGLPSVAMRAPAHPITRRLLTQTDFPLAAPSANPFGYLSPTLPEHVAAGLGPRIAAIIDGGPCSHGIESTILDLRLPDKISLLRPGPIDPEEIERILGRRLVRPDGTVKGQSGPQAAPGMLSKHYSPRAHIVLLPHNGAGKSALANAGPTEPLILNRRPPSEICTDWVYWLSEDGSPEECARNLFALLHRLDHGGARRIAIELAPSEGIGQAVNDRLRRAAAPGG